MLLCFNRERKLRTAAGAEREVVRRRQWIDGTIPRSWFRRDETTIVIFQRRTLGPRFARTRLVEWHDIADPAQRKLDDLATTYGIHPLHIEDCRQAGQRAKLATGEEYLFVCLKLFAPEDRDRLACSDLALFMGREFVITVHTGPEPLLEPLHASNGVRSSDDILYHVLDRVVESYLAFAELLDDGVEEMEAQVVDWPCSAVLENVGETRSRLLQFQRVLNATRHIAFQLRHVPNPLIRKDLSPFLRDVHDDLAIILDLIAGQRDRLAAVLDLYLSSVANRTTEATKTLTLLGTVALPALVITSLFWDEHRISGLDQIAVCIPCIVGARCGVDSVSSVVSATRRLPPGRQYRTGCPGGPPPAAPGKARQHARHLKRDSEGPRRCP
jgi:magnesium transporter